MFRPEMTPAPLPLPLLDIYNYRHRLGLHDRETDISGSATPAARGPLLPSPPPNSPISSPFTSTAEFEIYHLRRSARRDVETVARILLGVAHKSTWYWAGTERDGSDSLNGGSP